MEINFDGLIGPTHNYAGLSIGNRASHRNAGGTSHPRAAALQGLAKMRAVMALGVPQGFFPPHPRANLPVLHQLGFCGSPEAMMASAWRADPLLFANLFSASAMWTANAATVAPSADTPDGRLHMSPANLAAMFHRSTEAAFTTRILRTAFANSEHFVVHHALPGGTHMGDEGAANHGRLTLAHTQPGTQVFVHGENAGGRFPARQHRRASEAIARRHGLSAPVFLEQSDAAIEAGAFHNDVVGVFNGPVYFGHARAFEDPDAAHAHLRRAFPDIIMIVVPEDVVPLADAISSYLFNSQLITRPDGGMTLVLPAETQETPSVQRYLAELPQQGTPITALNVIDVRESMRNGGGPACLRLRVAVTPAEYTAIDPRFLLDDAKISALEACVATTYPEDIQADNLGDPMLHRQCMEAIDALARVTGLKALYDTP